MNTEIKDPFIKKLEQAKKKYSLSQPPKPEPTTYSFSGQVPFFTNSSNWGSILQTSGRISYP